MRNFTFLCMLFFSLFFGTKVYSQACSVVLSATDSLICSGDSIAMNALVNGPGLQMMGSNTGGNNHRGNMFDIVATNAVTILSFDASPMGNTTMSIYYKVGTWNGFANTPSAWTLIGSGPVPYTGGFSPIPVNVNVTIPAGQTYAFYVTTNVNGGTALNYSNGTAVGNVYSSDANITFLEGGGMEFPFTDGTGAVYQPRVWNGMIHYTLADQPGTVITWGTGETTASIPVAPTATTQYTVSADVPGCATLHDTLDVIVSLPPVVAHAAQTVCAGDEVLFYGTGADTYAWNNGITDSVAFDALATATYIVTGTDSIGCTENDTIVLTVHPLPNVTAGADFGVCIGNETTLTGQGADTYVWNHNVTDNTPFEPAATATYVVTGTDTNGCVQTDTVTVTVNPLPVVSAGPDLDLCQGIPYTFSGTGAQTYTWTNGVTNGVPAIPSNSTYTVTGTDANGCVSKDSMNVTIHNVMASVFPSGSMITAGVLVDMTAQWVNCSDMSPIAGETDVIFEPAHGGSYAIIVTDNVYGCSDTSNCVQMDFAGIDELTAEGLSVYPVPTNGKITIASTGTAIERVELIDLLGKVLQTAEPNAIQTELDLSGFESNTFLVRVYRAGQTALLKVVKN